MRCQYCEIEFVEGDKDLMRTIDHFIPVSKGGSRKSEYNQILSCSRCNRIKADLMPEDFLNKVQKQIDTWSSHDNRLRWLIIKKNIIGHMKIKQPYKFRIKRIKKSK